MGSFTKPIIVIIDDIDRLPPEEIRIIIQVVKAIGDFDRVSYLLAYEPDPIIKSLAYNGTYDGRRYLEKIVQASYPLPRIGYWHLKSFLNLHISLLLTDIKLDLSPTDKDILNEALDGTAIVRSLSSPRDVIRLVNRLRLSANNTRGEVNFSDALAFETLELKYPTISQAIRRQPEAFLKTSTAEGDFIFEDRFTEPSERNNHEKESPFIKELLSKETAADTKNIKSILNFIFPSIFSEWGSSSHEEEMISYRISKKETLLKLLHGGATKYLYSSKEVKHFLTSENGRHEILIDGLEAETLPGWLRYASEFTVESKIVNPLSIWNELLEISLTAFKEKKLDLTDDIEMFIISLLESKHIEDYEEKKVIINMVSSNDKSLSLSENILVALLSECDIWKSGIYNGLRKYTENELKKFPIIPTDLIEAKEVWLKTLRDASNKRDLISTEPRPISILFRWGQFNENDYKEVQEYIEKLTEEETSLRVFIDCFHGGNRLEGIEKLIGNLDGMINKIDRLEEQPLLGPQISKYLKAVIERSKGTSEE